jgi:hypothetical protein
MHLPMASCFNTTPYGRGYFAALTCFSLFSRPTRLREALWQSEVPGQQSHALWPWFFTVVIGKKDNLPTDDYFKAYKDHVHIFNINGSEIDGYFVLSGGSLQAVKQVDPNP